MVRTRPAGDGPLAKLGGVSGLSPDIRLFVNQSLLAGLEAAVIATMAGEKGAVDLSENDVCAWREGGHQEWRRERERIELLRLRSEVAREVAGSFAKSRNALTRMNEMLLASQLNDVLQDVDAHVLKEALADKPELYFRLASVVNEQASERTRRRKLKLDFEKYRDSVREQKEKILEAAKPGPSGGLTPEALAKIEEAAALL
jgi:hypothetical protein